VQTRQKRDYASGFPYGRAFFDFVGQPYFAPSTSITASGFTQRNHQRIRHEIVERDHRGIRTQPPGPLTSPLFRTISRVSQRFHRVNFRGSQRGYRRGLLLRPLDRLDIVPAGHHNVITFRSVIEQLGSMRPTRANLGFPITT